MNAIFHSVLTVVKRNHSLVYCRNEIQNLFTSNSQHCEHQVLNGILIDVKNYKFAFLSLTYVSTFV